MKFNLRKKSYSLSESAGSAKIPEFEFLQKESWKNQIYHFLVKKDFSSLTNYIKQMSTEKEFVTFLFSAYAYMIIEITSEYGEEYRDAFVKAIKDGGILLHD
jgi:hypothetical protein